MEQHMEQRTAEVRRVWADAPPLGVAGGQWIRGLPVCIYIAQLGRFDLSVLFGTLLGLSATEIEKAKNSLGGNLIVSI